MASDFQNPEAAAGLARVLLHTGGDLNRALSLAETAVKRLPESPRALDALGWAYYQRGAYALAIKSLERALQCEAHLGLPDLPEIRYHLALAYEKLQQPALARLQLERVLQLHPNDQAVTDVQHALARLNDGK